jgi:hypothetical protein
MKKGMWVGKILMGVVLFTAFIYVLIAGTQYLWNWLVPALFAGPVISFWQTAGLMLLAKILLWPVGGKCRCQGAHQGGPWKHYWKEKWSNMSAEERDRMKQKMKEKWCYKEPAGSTENTGTSNG